MLLNDHITMDCNNSVTSFQNIKTMQDLSGYNSDKEFYDMHSLDLWSRCKCKDNKRPSASHLLTPPTSPRHDPFCDSSSSSSASTSSSTSSSQQESDMICDALDCIDDETLQNAIAELETSEDLSTKLDMFASCLIQDCMWSGPGLQAAGFGVVQPIKKRLNSVDENCNSLLDKKSANDLTSSICVDPAVVFPNVSRNTTPSTQLTLTLPSLSSSSSTPFSQSSSPDWSVNIDTPSASESDEEIDVVGDEKCSSAAYRLSEPALSSAKSGRPTIRVINSGLSSMLSKNLPATTSMSAQVAAMHNYSSTPSIKTSQSCLRSTFSAPQTPNTGYNQLKRSRPFSSSPPSPQIYSKKQRFSSGYDKYEKYDKHHRGITNERDLHSVVRKLTSSAGRKSKPVHNSGSDGHSYSRGSGSDNEDLTEHGKRAYHNVLERKRRDDLRLSFHMLRCVVPEICDNERSPKMVILNSTTEYVLYLTQRDLKLDAEQRRQRLINEQLRRKLAQLQEDMY